MKEDLLTKVMLAYQAGDPPSEDDSEDDEPTQ